MPEREVLPRLFAIGDLVRVTAKGDMCGRVGTIGKRAHPASPWTWVVYNLPGAGVLWGTAVNDEDLELVAVEESAGV